MEAAGGGQSPAQPRPNPPGVREKPADAQTKPPIYLKFQFGLHGLQVLEHRADIRELPAGLSLGMRIKHEAYGAIDFT